jgi:DNA-binding cell septation regulator SpoVG
MTGLAISEVRFIRAPAQCQGSGLLGWSTIVIDDAVAVVIGVRQTLDGRLTLSFPTRVDAGGRQHDQAWPINQDSRASIERKVFAELVRQGEIPSSPHFRTNGASKDGLP